MSLIIALAIAVGINIIMFVPAFIYKTDKLTDISYAVTFATVGIVGFLIGGRSVAAIICLVMVLAWSVRLGTFLFIRISKTGKDSRFDGMRDHFWKFFRFWILQGVTVFVIMIPASFFLASRTHDLNVISWISLAVFVCGLAIESVADWQKFIFSSNPANKNTWINSGIWSYSRHPNYLGEMMVWIGMYVFVVSSLPLISALIGLVSPLYIVGLLLFVSGVPILEKYADQKWGNNPDYQTYKKRTSILILLPHLK